MASIAGVIAGLDRTLAKAREAIEHLRVAERAWRASDATLTGSLTGSSRPEVRDLTGFAAVTARMLDQARAAVAAGIVAVEAYRRQVAGEPAPSGATSTEADSAPCTVISPAGDVYPPSSAWAAHLIDQPYSPDGSGVPVIGIARTAGNSATFEFRPGASRWTDMAKARLSTLNAPSFAVKVDFHVEMQVAA